MIFYWKLGRKNDSVDTTGNCQQTKRVKSRFYPWKEWQYLRLSYKTAAQLVVVCWNSSRKLLQSLKVSKYLGASSTKECWLTMRDSSREVVFSHTRLQGLGGQWDMVPIPKEPWYLPTVKTLVLTLSTQVLTAKAAEGSPGNSYLLLDGSFSSTLSHRASCREELAKPLPFCQGSLKDVGHTNPFLLP